MQIWLDTTNIDLVKKADRLGILYGVTTNPALIAQSGKEMKTVLQELLDHQDGPVTAQVMAPDTRGMIEQGQRLYDFSDRIIVKVPVSHEGYEAINTLTAQEIPTMATVILEPHQALVAALAGAHYVAPYVGQIEKSGKNHWDVLAAMLAIFEKNHIDTQIVAASISTLEQVTRCAEMGVPHITLKDEAFSKLIATSQSTLERVNQFAAAWSDSKTAFL